MLGVREVLEPRVGHVHVTTDVGYGQEPPGGGGTPLYGQYRYVRPQRVCFLAVLVINRVWILADFGHFGHK